MEKENREYKDSVFTDLFSSDITAKKNQVELFNALHGTTYTTDDVEIDEIKVEQTLYMNFKNDISWEMGKKCLVFAEHQSTINGNMCVRFLLYAGRTYEQLIPVRSRYVKKRLQLQRPEFYVFYNGLNNYPLEQEIRLSDSFMGDESDGINLELIVRVININLDKKHPILTKCPILYEYMQFVNIVRKYKKSGKDDALKHAIRESIEKGILQEYLLRKGSEVHNMLIAEYDYEMDIQTQREEAEEIGKEEGIAIDEKRGITIGEMNLLLVMIQKKLAKGRSVKQIVEETESDEATVRRYIAAIEKADNPDNIDQICSILMNN